MLANGIYLKLFASNYDLYFGKKEPNFLSRSSSEVYEQLHLS